MKTPAQVVVSMDAQDAERLRLPFQEVKWIGDKYGIKLIAFVLPAG